MLINDVKPIHCQNVLNILDNKGYAWSSMQRTRAAMSIIFKDACENDLIDSTPVTKC